MLPGKAAHRGAGSPVPDLICHGLPREAFLDTLSCCSILHIMSPWTMAAATRSWILDPLLPCFLNHCFCAGALPPLHLLGARHSNPKGCSHPSCCQIHAHGCGSAPSGCIQTLTTEGGVICRTSAAQLDSSRLQAQAFSKPSPLVPVH